MESTAGFIPGFFYPSFLITLLYAFTIGFSFSNLFLFSTITSETGEIVSIPGNYLIQKCKKCGEIKRPYGLQGQCKECETKERK